MVFFLAKGPNQRRYAKPLTAKKNPRTLERRLRQVSNRRSSGYLNIEKKFLDTAVNASIGGTITGSESDPALLNCINGVAQGNGESEREGRLCKWYSLEIRGHITFDALSGSGTILTQGYARIVVLIDTQSNGAQFNAEDVLRNEGIAGALSINAPRNIEFEQRFKILKDFIVKQGPMDSISESATQNRTGGQLKTFRCFHRLAGWKSTHTGTGGSISSVTDNSLHVMAFTTGLGGNITYTARLRYFT